MGLGHGLCWAVPPTPMNLKAERRWSWLGKGLSVPRGQGMCPAAARQRGPHELGFEGKVIQWP